MKKSIAVCLFLRKKSKQISKYWCISGCIYTWIKMNIFPEFEANLVYTVSSRTGKVMWKDHVPKEKEEKKTTKPNLSQREREREGDIKTLSIIMSKETTIILLDSRTYLCSVNHQPVAIWCLFVKLQVWIWLSKQILHLNKQFSLSY